MSQEKVDRNKAAKANRKKDMQKEKTAETIEVDASALADYQNSLVQAE